MTTRELFTKRVRLLTGKLNAELERDWILIEDSSLSRGGTDRCWRWYDGDLYLMAEIAFAFGAKAAQFDPDLHWSGYHSASKAEYDYCNLNDAIGYVEDFLRAEA